ncbi:hypothetical protein HMPREF3160_02970 [Arthrobacter sp. HMSC06H05]|uniref:ABC transport system permease protein n=1 Tax=Pseudoglutamicibacter albus TaxID=98671 RepID=A0ABU1YZ93_9MICC|nr:MULTISPECIES: FtsX-like permease family protein [Micrococcaceae]MDR7293684.1 putative ABC transport system permease protein [Pseudoglutamicibacter albus]OFT43363.1 hypothetical protein HMPREF3160_02970 [Arthrobacter sp. HMSC06H05]
MNTIARANVRAYLRRYIAVILAVTIGVAFLSAVMNFSTSSKASLANSQGQVYSQSDVVVQVKDTGKSQGDPEKAAQGLEQIDKIVTSNGSVADHAMYQSAMIFSLGGGYDPLTLYAVKGDWSLFGFKKLEGEFPDGKSIGISKEIKQRFKGSQDSSAPALTLGYSPDSDGQEQDPEEAKPQKYEANGVFEDSMMIDDVGLPLVFMDYKQAEASGLLMGSPEPVYLLKLTPGSNPDEIVRQIKTAVQKAGIEGVTVATPEQLLEQSMENIGSSMVFVTVALFAFVLLSAVVCVLVTSNTFTVVLAQRTRELALLRTIGANSKQIKSMMRTEGLLVGLIGGVVGVALGIALIAGGGSIMAWVTKSSTFQFAFNWWSLPAGMVLAVVMTWLASIRPAKKASSLSPIAALQPQETVTVGSRKGKKRITTGVLLILLGAVFIGIGMAGPAVLPVEDDADTAAVFFLVVFLGCVLAFLGLLVVATFLVPFLVGQAGKPFAGKPAGKLAGLNAVRHPARTGAVGSALMIGVVLVAACLTGMFSLRATMNNMISNQFPIDAKVYFEEDKLPTDKTLENVAKANEVEAAVLVKPAKLTEDQMAETSCSALYVGDVEALKKVVPSNVPLPGANEFGPVGKLEEALPLKIKGTTLKPHGTASRAAVPCMIDIQTAQKLNIETLDEQTQIWAKLDEDVKPTTASEVIANAAHVTPQNLELAAQEKEAYDATIMTFTLIVVGLFGVAVLIALVGVSNTLTLSILERTRENALLRALGLTRKQLRSMLFLEAFLIAGITALAAVIFGTLFGYFGSTALLRLMDGAEFTIPWIPLFILWVATVAITMLATVLPARRAAKITPVEGLAVE